MTIAQLRISPKENRLYFGGCLQERKITVDELKNHTESITTLVVSSESFCKKKKSFLGRFLKKIFKKKEVPLDINDLLFLPVCREIRECRVLEPYDRLDELFRHPVFINSTDSFTFEGFTPKVCDFLIVHKQVKHLSIMEIRAPGLATVIKHNPDMELVNIRFVMMSIDVLAIIELLFAAQHNPCTIHLLNCWKTREIARHLHNKGFTTETSFDADEWTVLRVTHEYIASYFVEIAFRNTLSIYALRDANS